MRLHGVRQDASVDLITDCGIVFGIVYPMSGFILSDPEVDDFELDGNAGIEPNVHEHAKWMDGDDFAPHLAATRQGRLNLVPPLLAQWITGPHAAVFLEGLAPDE